MATSLAPTATDQTKFTKPPATGIHRYSRDHFDTAAKGDEAANEGIITAASAFAHLYAPAVQYLFDRLQIVKRLWAPQEVHENVILPSFCQEESSKSANFHSYKACFL
jgi:hypothetical protein